MDKTRDSTNSKIWPDSTCAISVRRKGQILLVVESRVLSTTFLSNLSLFVALITLTNGTPGIQNKILWEAGDYRMQKQLVIVVIG